jgi:hypothetical protein
MNKTLMCTLLCIFVFACTETPKEVISRMDINTQADIDFICDNLPEGDTFEGNVIATTDVELNYKCLSALRNIEGTVILDGPKTTEAFKNLETVIGGEVFAICDNAVDTISFPNLRIVTGGGFSISSFCQFTNVLHVPNIEILSNISIGSPAFSGTGMRSGTLIGFDKLEEINNMDLDIDFSNEYFKIDGFSNLKKVNGTFKIIAIGNSFNISEKSFSNLTEINEGKIYKNFDENQTVNLVDILPNLKFCKNLEVYNFDPLDACYLNDQMQSSEVDIQMLHTLTNEYFNNESLLDLCN